MTLPDNLPVFDFYYLAHQRQWSDETFGPGRRIKGLVDHISKELVEVTESGGSLAEWADVVILAFDGATRAAVANGGTVADVLLAVSAKQAENEMRDWPDWRTADPEKAIEHVR